MRNQHPLLSILLLTASACTSGTDEAFTSTKAAQDRAGQLHGRSAMRQLLFTEDELIQHTCALYVAVRSHAWDDQISFGRDMDGSAVHWNTCPGGTMVACKVMPTANGDSVITGIPLQ